MEYGTMFQAEFTKMQSLWAKTQKCIEIISLSQLCCYMMTSSMETFSALLALCAGNSPVPGDFPAQRPVTRSFDVFSDLRLNKRLSKPSWGWWFETQSGSLWRHCNDLILTIWYIFQKNKSDPASCWTISVNINGVRLAETTEMHI